MSEKWSKEFDSCFQVGSIEEIADALEKRSGSEENALAMLAMTAFTLMTRRGICEMQNVAPDGKGIRLELIGFRENETIPDTLHCVTNGAIVIHTQRLKSDPGGNLLS